MSIPGFPPQPRGLQIPPQRSLQTPPQRSLQIPEDVFRSPRLLYRAWDEKTDAPILHEWLQDPQTLAYMWSKAIKPAGMTTAEGWTKYASVALLLVVVCLPSPTSPTPIGIVDLPPPDASSSQNRTTGVGIIIGRPYQGMGYGTEAMRWTLGMAFKRYGFHRVGLAVAEGNAGARRVYEKAGFVYEGVKRKNTWLEGQWWDTIIMGILETEWLAIQEKEAQEAST